MGNHSERGSLSNNFTVMGREQNSMNSEFGLQECAEVHCGQSAEFVFASHMLAFASGCNSLAAAPSLFTVPMDSL